MASKVSLQQQLFVEKYLSDPDMNGTAAYRHAYPACKSDEAAAVGASRLLSSAKVQEELARQRSERSERTKITQDKVLQHFWAIATANPNELIEHRRVCCRHCWGDGFNFQRTDREMARDRAAHEKAVAEFKPGKNKTPPGAFEEAGGVGYDERRGPNPGCPECFGDGVGKTVAKDTRQLSREGRRLYAGVKQTKEGLEIKVHDQAAALVNVAKLQGYFTANLKLSGSVTMWNLDKLTDDELRSLALIAARATGDDSLRPDPPEDEETAPSIPVA